MTVGAMLVCVVWCALALGARASTAAGDDSTCTGAWSVSEYDEVSTVGTARAIGAALSVEATLPAEWDSELYTDTVTDSKPTPSDLPLAGPPAAAPANDSLPWERGRRRSEYKINTQLLLDEVLFLQRGHRGKLEGSSGMMVVVVVILPGVVLLVVFLVVIANTATPMKVPYSNTKEGIVPPWMLHEYTLQNVKCYPAYGQV